MGLIPGGSFHSFPYITDVMTRNIYWKNNVLTDNPS